MGTTIGDTRTCLTVGDIIEVRGYVMLAGLDAGFYRVKSVSLYYGKPSYTFTKPRGRKPVARHYTCSVDSWLGHAGDHNGIDAAGF